MATRHQLRMLGPSGGGIGGTENNSRYHLPRSQLMRRARDGESRGKEGTVGDIAYRRIRQMTNVK